MSDEKNVISLVRRFRADKVPAPAPGMQEVNLPPPPYDIEVGCGVGYHPIQYAVEHPDRTLLAIERTHERFRKFLGRIEGNKDRLGENLVAIHSDALPWIVHHIPPNSVGRYFFLYPNPFPKHRRLYAMPFMEYVVETMQAGGTLAMATNIEEYYLESKEYFIHHWRLQCIEDRLISGVEAPRTHFEKKYLARGEPCWNLVFQKPILNSLTRVDENGEVEGLLLS